MYEILLIRHSITAGNLENRYVGSTDAKLCKEGIKLAKLVNIEYEEELEKIEKIFSSPMKRCIQTANILFDGKESTIIEELKEADFGKFEYRTLEELEVDSEFLKWKKDNNKEGYPEGENFNKFNQRVLNGFFDAFNLAICEGIKNMAIVTHGVVIRKIMNSVTMGQYDEEHWQVNNCEGFRLEFDENGKLTNIDRLQCD